MTLPRITLNPMRDSDWDTHPRTSSPSPSPSPLPSLSPSTSRSKSLNLEELQAKHRALNANLLAKHQETRDVKRLANSSTIWAMGMAMVSTGVILAWGLGLQLGTGGFLVITVLNGLGFICLAMCLAEMSSALPFAGGAYGFARVTLGMYPGFVIGCFESLEYILYNATTVFTISQLILGAAGVSLSFTPALCVGIHVVAIGLHSYDGALMWRLFWILAISAIFVEMLYLFGTIPSMNFGNNAYAAHHSLFDGSSQQYLIAYASFNIFVGIEILPLASEETLDPKTNVPKGIVATAWTQFVIVIVMIVATVSNSPGIQGLRYSLFPLEYGLTALTGIQTAADCLMLPATFGTVYCLIFAYSRQMYAMSKSNLLPSVLSYCPKQNGIPVGALVIGGLISVALSISCCYNTELLLNIFQLQFIGVFVCYISQFLSFSILRIYYSTIDREYTNPLGLFSAAYGIVVFTVFLIPGFVYYKYSAVAALVIFVVCSLYYFIVARNQQCFAPEERATLFVAYIIRVHRLKKRRPRSTSKLMTIMKKSSGPPPLESDKRMRLFCRDFPPTPYRLKTCPHLAITSMKQEYSTKKILLHES